MASKILELKTKMAKAHLKTHELTNALVSLGDMIDVLEIDSVIKAHINKQFKISLELTGQVRGLVEVGK